MAVVEIGIRELRADLSKWVQRVRRGDEVVVTDRGTPVARLVPAKGERTLDRLIREGVVEPAPSRKRPAPKPIEGANGISDLVIEGRGPR
jgi:prevent-host-death family protein